MKPERDALLAVAEAELGGCEWIPGWFVISQKRERTLAAALARCVASRLLESMPDSRTDRGVVYRMTAMGVRVLFRRTFERELERA